MKYNIKFKNVGKILLQILIALSIMPISLYIGVVIIGLTHLSILFDLLIFAMFLFIGIFFMGVYVVWKVDEFLKLNKNKNEGND